MYIKWFNWIIMLVIIYAIKILGVTRILKSSQRNGKLPLPWQKQSNYLVITIYANGYTFNFYLRNQHYTYPYLYNIMLPIDWQVKVLLDKLPRQH